MEKVIINFLNNAKGNNGLFAALFAWGIIVTFTILLYGYVNSDIKTNTISEDIKACEVKGGKYLIIEQKCVKQISIN